MSVQPFLGLTLLAGNQRMYCSPGATVYRTYPIQPASHFCHSDRLPGHHTPSTSTSTNTGSAGTRRPASSSTTGTLARPGTLGTGTYETIVSLIERGKL